MYCQICSSAVWRNLPDPTDGQTVTTSGRMLAEPLGKAQCAACGFVQRTRARFLGETDFYEQDYAGYYDRPGTARFHAARYRALTQWMADALGSAAPRRMIDVGCGQGWGMAAMQSLYPRASIKGLEPSRFNSEAARDKGFTVYQARLGEADFTGKEYDLVFSTNVIQHVVDARSFVAALRALAGATGVVVITCPDASVPNIELLWGDQNFSFLPAHLGRLATGVGFGAMRWFSSPPTPSLPPAQMLVLSSRAQRAGPAGSPIPVANLDRIFDEKRHYLQSFREIDAYLCAQIGNQAPIYNFGASYWSSILAAYCPSYWARVSACVIDDADEHLPRFFDKPVRAAATIEEEAVVVFGTSPATHAALRERAVGRHVVSWDQFAPRC